MENDISTNTPNQAQALLPSVERDTETPVVLLWGADRIPLPTPETYERHLRAVEVEALSKVPLAQLERLSGKKWAELAEQCLRNLDKAIQKLAPKPCEDIVSYRKRYQTAGHQVALFNDDRSGMADRARQLLVDAHESSETLFVDPLDRPVRIDADGKKTTVDTIADAEDLIRRAVHCCSSASYPAKQIDIPAQVARHIRRHPHQDLRLLQGVVRLPQLRADGSQVPRGYDLKSRKYHAPEVQVEIPDRPTHEQVTAARSFVLEPLKDFPFPGGQTGPGGILAAIAVPLLANQFNGPRPLIAIEAPEGGQGTGKTLLASLAGSIITGRRPAATSLHSGEAELAKTIASMLLEDAQFALLDNVTGLLSSDSLAALATSNYFRPRILGHSKAPRLPNAATWVLTMNGGRLSTDLARRTLMIQLNAGKQAYRRPASSFRIADPIGWALKNRQPYIQALLTLVRGWIQAGKPKWSGPNRGGFETWLATVGGFIEWMGLGQGLLAAFSASDRANDERAQDEQFVRGWWAQFSGGTLDTGTLVGIATQLGLYASVLNAGRQPGSTWQQRDFNQKVMARVLDDVFELQPRLTVRVVDRSSQVRAFALEVVK